MGKVSDQGRACPAETTIVLVRCSFEQASPALSPSPFQPNPKRVIAYPAVPRSRPDDWSLSMISHSESFVTGGGIMFHAGKPQH